MTTERGRCPKCGLVHVGASTTDRRCYYDDLIDALGSVGADAHEDRILRWLAGTDMTTVAAFVSLFRKLRGVVLVAMLALPATTRADPWTRADTAYEVAFATAAALDCSTTLDIRHHAGHWEAQPLLGPHPSDARIRATCAAAVAVHAGIARALPASWRRVWQVFYIGLETGAVARNVRSGLRFRW